MYQHDESSSTDVVNTPGEADEQDGRYVVNNLLLEVLKTVTHSEWRRVPAGNAVAAVAQASLRGNRVIMLCCRNTLGLLAEICPAAVSCLKLSKVLSHTHV